MTGDFPVLLGDIGGTNARFAVLPCPGASTVALPRVLTADFPDPAAAIRAVLSARPGLPAPRSAILAVAAPVEDTIVPLTNAPWVVDASRIGAQLSLARVALVNDYVPVAVALCGLEPGEDDLTRLGPSLSERPGPRLALGPGTGLGAAALVPVGDRFAVLSTEAGHAEFGPADAFEAALWPGIERVGGRVTAETLLSGPGLLRLYRALAGVRGAPASCACASDVTAAGRLGQDEIASETLRLFARLLGRFAGDLALIFGATGGAYLASGIAPRLADVLGRDGFREAFDNKAPHDAWMRKIPTWVVTHPEPALLGLSLIAEQPDRFVFDGRSWMQPESHPLAFASVQS